MNIAFDIDGVLTNIEKYQLEVARAFYKKKYNRDIVNPEGFSVKEIYDVTDEEFMDFWSSHLLSYSIKELSRVGASECIKKLANEGNNIFIITSRELADKDNFLGKLMRSIVKYWLKREGIPYSKIVFCNGDKVEAIKQNQIQVMVEDDPKNITSLCEYVKVICMDAGYNEKIKHPNVTHVRNFNDIYEEVQRIRKDIRAYLDNPITARSGKMSIDQVHRRFYNEKQANLFLTDESIYEFVYRNNKDNMRSLAIDYYDHKMTFKNFFDKVDECARALVAYGVHRKDIVSVCMPNTPEAVIMVYAINKIGAVANMIHPMSGEEEIKHYLQETNSKFVLAIDMSVDKLKRIIGNTGVNKVVVTTPAISMPMSKRVGYKFLSFIKKYNITSLNDSIDEKSNVRFSLSHKFLSLVPNSIKKQMKSVTHVELDNDTFVSWSTFIKSGKKIKGDVHAKFDKDEMAFILHTGGSTGASKGVMLSNENVNANTIQLQFSMPPYQADDKVLAITPIFHGFGLVDCIHNAFAVNMSVILLPQYERESYTKALLKKPFLVIGVPTLLDSTIHLKELQNIDQPYTLFISGGSPLFREKEEEANAYTLSHNGKYLTAKGGGMTEATAAFSFTMDGANKPESVGVPLPLNKIKIIDPTTGNELGPNEQGEICICGPTVMLGYYNDEEETRKALQVHEDGKTWLHTGDVGYLDEDGILFYTGRIKRMIISSGYNIYPQQIEKVFMQHPNVCDTVIIGIPDDHKGHVAKAFIVLKNKNVNIERLKKEIYDLCYKHLAKYAIPIEIEVVDSLPKTLYNKTDFRKVEEEELEKIKGYQKVLK